MNKTRNISRVLVALLVIMLIFAGITTVFADKYSDGSKTTFSPKEFTKDKNGNTITEGGYIKTTGTGASNVKEVGGKIVGLIRVVGTIAAVAMLTILGIKYMMGSAEERAEYKKTLFPYLVGAVLIFAATNLAQVVYSWASKI